MAIPSSTDAADARRVHTDDRAARIARHQARVWRYLRCLGAPGDLAEDLAQDTFLAALGKGMLDRDDQALGGWLCATARNLFRLELRRRGRAPAGQHLDWAAPAPAAGELAWQWLAGADGGDDGEAALRALSHCMTLLDEREQQALRLRYRDSLPRDAMASALGLSAAGIKALLRRIRARLRACIERRRRDER